MPDWPLITSWLAYFADPARPGRGRPARVLGADEVTELIDQAAGHGVLPAVVANLRAAQASGQADRVVAAGAEPALVQALAGAEQTLVAMVGLTMMITFHGRRIEKALRNRGLRVMLVKGAMFADRIYPKPALRTFGDVDLLVHPEDMAAAREGLAENGLRFHAEPDRDGYFEEKWTLESADNILFELHDDMIGSPKFRPRVSLQFSHLAPGNDLTCEPTPAGLLVLAAVHGATSHRYDRLQQIVDLCLIGRGAAGPIVADELADLTARTGSKLSVLSGLDLADRLFDAPECGALADRLGRTAASKFARMLLGPEAVLLGQCPLRSRYSWRGQIFRELIART
jgi:Uncharacterised nucleotidyltransferase